MTTIRALRPDSTVRPSLGPSAVSGSPAAPCRGAGGPRRRWRPRALARSARRTARAPLHPEASATPPLDCRAGRDRGRPRAQRRWTAHTWRDARPPGLDRRKLLPRLAYVEVVPTGRRRDARAFFERTLRWLGERGITVEAVMTDNGAAYAPHAWLPVAGPGARAAPPPGATALRRCPRRGHRRTAIRPADAPRRSAGSTARVLAPFSR